MRASTGNAVAAIAVPMNSAKRGDVVHVVAVGQPHAQRRAQAQRQDDRAERHANAQPLAAPDEAQVHLVADDEHEEDQAESASAVSGAIRLRGNSVSVILPWKNVGPSRIPTRISPITGGWPMRLASVPSSLARMMMMATSASSSCVLLRLRLMVPRVDRMATCAGASRT